VRPADTAARRDRVRQRLAGDGVGALIVTSPANIRYLSGFTGSQGTVVVGSEPGLDRLVTDARYARRAEHEARDIEAVIGQDPSDVVEHLLGGGAVVGLEAGHVSWAVARQWRSRLDESGGRVVATSGVVEAERSVKDDGEIAAITAACAVTAEAMRWLIDGLRPGRSEREVATALERRFIDLGAEGVAFPSIVATGVNGAVPHHRPGDRQLAPGELVTIDAGAVVDGYHADCTRTVAVGTPDERLAEIHAIVAEAQGQGVEAVTAGISCGDVDEAARATIEAAGYGAAFVHGTGHGVGLEIHEAPAVTRGATATLAPGAVITVEPGIYLADVGGVRIEDTLVVTDHGSRRLTDLSHGLDPA
jgi:Xaa-Pro aminopeptidase